MKPYRSYAPVLGLLFTVMLMVFGREVKSQSCTAPLRVYADAESHGHSSSGLATSSVDDPTFAVGANLSTNATALNVATLAGAAEAWTELKFTNATNPLLPLPAGTTTYVKIGGTSAGALLGLIGGASLPVYAYSGATSTPAADGSLIASSNVKVTNLTTSAGTIYLAITPSVPYNAVRIALNASVLIGTGKLLVYHAFYQGAGVSCDPPLGASTGVSGLLTLGGGITNPNRAIDGNLSTYAAFSMGVAGVGTTLRETVYFPGPSIGGDAATITFSIPPALLLDLSLLNNISMTPYNGSTAGTPVSLSSLLSLDLLALLRANNIVTVSLVPTTTFDRIEISMGSLLSLLATMNLYEVQRTPAKPTFTAPESSNVTICYGQSATLSATTGTCNELHWYTVPTGGIASIGATYATGNLTATTTYYVAAAKIGCTVESERVPIIVNVNPLPTATISGTTSVCQDATAPSITFTGNGGTAPYTFTYNINGGAQQTIPTVTGNSVTIPAPTDVAGSFIYNLVSVKENSSTQCSQNQTGTVTIVVKPTPALTSPLSTSACSNTVFSYIPISSITGTVFTWTRAAVPGISNTAVTIPNSGSINETLINTTTLPIDVKYLYNLTINGCSKEVEVTITVNPIPTLSSTQTPSSICSNTIFDYIPESTTNGVAFTWTRAAVPGLSNPAITNETIGSISETLINTTSLPIIVTYVYYLTKNGCTNTQGAIVTVNPSPSITLGSSPFICQGVTIAPLIYSVPSANPTVYSITWGSLAQTAGLSDVPFLTLPASPINLTIPANIAAGTYSGTLTVKNGNGCISTPINFNLIVHTRPTAPQIITQ